MTYTVALLFLQSVVRPSLMVLAELIIPLAANHSHSFFAQSR